MDPFGPEPRPAPQAAAPAFDSFAELLASATVRNHGGPTVIDLGGGCKLRLENVQVARIAAGFLAA